MAFLSKNEAGDLTDIYVTEKWLIDRFVGSGLFAWGENNFGQLGQGDITNRSSPTQVGSLTDWIDVATISQSTYAIKANGTLWAWGVNQFGQLGDGTITYRSSPVQVGALTNWLYAKMDHGIASSVRVVKADGTLWAWGQNNFGQLGDGTTTNRSSPVQIGSLTTWDHVSNGSRQLAAIRTNGTLWTCGYDIYGALGISGAGSRSSPVQVGVLTNWKQVSAGSDHMAAVKTDGTLWTWGKNVYGQLGNGNRSSTNSPVQVGALTNWKTVMAKADFVLAIKTDGTLWSWGRDRGGNLGLGVGAGSKSSPVQVGAFTDWIQVACGYGHSLGLRSNGRAYTWGQNNFGQLGQGDRTTRSTPTQLGTKTTWSQIAAGYTSSAAILFG